MHLCEKVHAYEFVPSKTRNPGLNIKCHYYDSLIPEVIHQSTSNNKSSSTSKLNHRIWLENNKRCDVYGFERWHPMTNEKNVLYRMNSGSDTDVFIKGVVTLPGFNSVECWSFLFGLNLIILMFSNEFSIYIYAYLWFCVHQPRLVFRTTALDLTSSVVWIFVSFASS
jgi:hypothetical protein